MFEVLEAVNTKSTPGVTIGSEIRDPKARLELKRIRDTVQHLGGESEGGEGKNVITDVPGWAVKAVSEFARRTGDYEVLSLTDLKVLAVGYWREIVEGGEGNIRSIEETENVHVGKEKEKKKQKKKKKGVGGEKGEGEGEGEGGGRKRRSVESVEVKRRGKRRSKRRS